MLTITPLAEAGVDVLPPDIVWNGMVGDVAISTRSQDGGIGGYIAKAPIATAVILLLFSDAPVDLSELDPDDGGDRRGWPGDSFDIDPSKAEGPMGSHLWRFRRRALNGQTATELEDEIQRALSPLLRQQAVARIDVTAEAKPADDTITATVKLYGRDGRTIYAEKFDPLWKRTDAL